MEIVKKNILSIICGVVALVALIAYLFPIRGAYSDLSKKMDERAGKTKELSSLLTGQYNKPVVTDDEPVPLGAFPNRPTIDEAKKVIEAMKSQAKLVLDEVARINKQGHEPLVPGALPLPDDQRKFEWRNQYNLVMARGGKPIAPAVNLPDAVLESALPPTETEMSDAKTNLWKEKYMPSIYFKDGRPQNDKEVAAEFFKVVKDFEGDFRKQRATNYKIYLEPTALLVNQRVADARLALPSAADIWYTQMSLWIQQDVCRSIAEANKLSHTVPTSPVKHLVSIDVKQDMSMYVMNTPAVGAAPVPPPEGAAAAAGADKDYTRSPTGRVSNSIYDVTQFEMIVVLDTQYVKPFVQLLQQGKFLHVLEMDLQNVDLAEALDEGYDYGNRPVVEVRLKCEALFLREWTVMTTDSKSKPGLMPAPVQKELGIGAAVAVPPADAATPTP